MTEPLLSFFSDPLSVVVDVLREPLCGLPLLGKEFFSLTGNWINWRSSGKHCRYLNFGFIDQHGNWIEVAGIGLQSQALCLQGQSTSACERIMEAGQLLRIEQLCCLGMIGVICAGTSPAAADFGPGSFQQRFIRGVLPGNQFADQRKQS